METEGSEEAHIELNKSHAELRQALLVEEWLWSQRARVKWLAHGDCNSKFFHTTVKQQ